MIIVGIAGGTGSGKTTFARALQNTMADDSVIISQDSYYRAHRDLSFSERLKINYDHPDAFEDELLVAQLKKLRAGKKIEVPVYDFTAYTRSTETVPVRPQPIVIVEGILVLANPKLRELFDLKVFVDTDPDVRILRRLVRDVEERDRTLSSVHSQYLATVKPMHEAFVEPSKKYADLIVPEGGFNTVALETVAAVLKQYLQDGENRLASNGERGWVDLGNTYPIAIFNGPVCTTNGLYRISDLGVEEAKELIARHGFESAVGHEASAQVLSAILEVEVPMKRIEYSQAVGQKAIALKLNVRPPEGQILSAEEMFKVGFELKLLERIS